MGLFSYISLARNCPSLPKHPVHMYIRTARTYVCVFAATATETERVKVAESAGQHESTGNVSRELGVGVTAASLWMRRERDGDGWKYEETRERAYTRARVKLPA